MTTEEDPAVDPVSAALGAGAAKAVSKVADKAIETGLPARLFGPVCDEVGAVMGSRVREWNINQIAKKAARRSRVEAPKVVHARVAYRVLQDGSFCNDDVMQEYLAGMVAGSYSEDGGDDRSSYYVDLVARLPAGHVRLHHAVYSALATVGGSDQYGYQTFLDERGVIVPLETAAAVVAAPRGVAAEDAVGEALTSLHREGLLSGTAVLPAQEFPAAAYDDGVVVGAQPSIHGIMLMLWAHGIRDADTSRLGDVIPCDFDPPGPTFADWRFRRGIEQSGRAE